MAVVTQFYITEAENEYVIKGNAAIMKCKIPSFVTDFVQVETWINAEDGTEITSRTDDSQYGCFSLLFTVYSLNMCCRRISMTHFVQSTLPIYLFFEHKSWSSILSIELAAYNLVEYFETPKITTFTVSTPILEISWMRDALMSLGSYKWTTENGNWSFDLTSCSHLLSFTCGIFPKSEQESEDQFAFSVNHICLGYHIPATISKRRRHFL